MAKSRTILIADDNDDILEYMSYVLEKEGYTILVARNGAESMRICASTSIDLLITDLIMPEKEGLETIKDLHSKNGQLGVIAMSGSAQSITYFQVAQCFGAHAVLQKPFSNQVLIGTVKEVLEKMETNKGSEKSVTEILPNGERPGNGY